VLRLGLFAAVVALALLFAVPTFGAVEEHCGVVTRVVDGDTFYVSGLPERVRLADVDAPELSTAEGQRAKAALEALLLGRRVCLDIDDLYKTDRYGRFVAVAYLDYNETHWLNVNQWLVERGYAAYVDYPNEFHPPWPLYLPKAAAPKATTSVTPVTVTVTQTSTTTVATTNTVTATVTVTKTVTDTVVVTHTVTQKEPVTYTVTTTTTVTETAIAFGGYALALLAVVVALLLMAAVVAKLAKR